MLKCEMCLGRRIDAEMAVLRSADRGIEYHEGNAIEISNDNRISVKVDNATIRVDPVSGALTVEIPDVHAVNSIVEVLSRYPLNHNYNTDLRPLVTDGPNRGKWATENLGANNKHIYMDGGVLKESNANIGAGNNPVFVQSGVTKASQSSIGANNKHVYMNNGVITASDNTIGSSTKPVYINSGAQTECGSSLDVDISGTADKAIKDNDNQIIKSTYVKNVEVLSDNTLKITKGDGTSSTSNTLATALSNLSDSIGIKMIHISVSSADFNHVFNLVTLCGKPLSTYLVLMIVSSRRASGGSSGIVNINNLPILGFARVNGTNYKIDSGLISVPVSSWGEVTRSEHIVMNDTEFTLGALLDGNSCWLIY